MGRSPLHRFVRWRARVAVWSPEVSCDEVVDAQSRRSDAAVLVEALEIDRVLAVDNLARLAEQEAVHLARIRCPRVEDHAIAVQAVREGQCPAAFHPGLEWTKAELVIRKGFRKEIDSYSAFFENDHKTPTGLAGYLKERGISKVTLAGLATDFCVAYSALDAVRSGLQATVAMEACRAIDLGGTLAAMTERMKAAGVTLAWF